MKRLIVLAGLAVTACVTTPSGGGREGSTIELSPCLLPNAAGNRSIKASCGSWSVPEDRRLEDGRRLDLRVAIVPAVSRSPAPYPVLLLAGGPGQAATEAYGLVEAAFADLHRDHDILLIDQRGTGGSNPLRCAQVQPEAILALDDESVVARIVECRDELEADLTRYTTEAAVADFEEVRRVLGYPQLHLYGASYGTRVGLHYLRRHPESVRTAVLDGVVPPSLTLGPNIAPDAQRALERIFRRCASQQPCRDRFPELKRQFSQVMERLRRSPVSLSLTHPRRGTPLEFEFSPEMFATAVRLLSYAPETAAILPLLIDSAARGDWKPAAGQFLMVADSLNRSIAGVMGLSVNCTEDFPFIEPAAAERMAAGTYLGPSQTRTMQRLCADWPRGTVQPDFREPVTADVPVLLLSGEDDPVTPPGYGEEVAASLPRAVHIVVPGAGHNVLPRGCVPELVTELVRTEDPQSIDARCVNQILPVPFFVNFAGPIPVAEIP